MESARRQPRWLARQPDRIARAASFCRRYGVVQLAGFDPRVGKAIVRLERTDPAAPASYPAEYEALRPIDREPRPRVDCRDGARA